MELSIADKVVLGIIIYFVLSILVIYINYSFFSCFYENNPEAALEEDAAQIKAIKEMNIKREEKLFKRNLKKTKRKEKFHNLLSLHKNK